MARAGKQAAQPKAGSSNQNAEASSSSLEAPTNFPHDASTTIPQAEIDPSLIDLPNEQHSNLTAGSQDVSLNDGAVTNQASLQDVEAVVEQAITSADEDMLDPDWREIVNSLTNASQVCCPSLRVFDSTVLTLSIAGAQRRPDSIGQWREWSLSGSRGEGSITAEPSKHLGPLYTGESE